MAQAPGGTPDTSSEQTEWLTNLSQLRRNAEQQPLQSHPFRIVADVFDVDPAAGVLVLRDASGIEFIQLELRDKQLEPGSKVCLEATGCGVKTKSFGLAIVPGMVADNDGIHGMMTQSGTAFLHAGTNPLTCQWFNRLGDFGLAVDFEGPGLSRRRIPNRALVRAQVNAAGSSNLSRGLDYKCFQGAWTYLPDFAKLHPVKTGVATNFDLEVRTRKENVGLEFTGFIKIPRDGLYTFHLASDDGARLMIGEPLLDVRVLSQAVRGLPC